MKITQDLGSMFTKRITIEFESGPQTIDEIFISKRIDDSDKSNPVYAATTVTFSSSLRTIAVLDRFIEALMVAREKAEWLDAEYPVGQNIFE